MAHFILKIFKETEAEKVFFFSNLATPGAAIFPLHSVCKMTSSFFSLSLSWKTLLYLARSNQLTFLAFSLEISLLKSQSFLDTLSYNY